MLLGVSGLGTDTLFTSAIPSQIQEYDTVAFLGDSYIDNMCLLKKSIENVATAKVANCDCVLIYTNNKLCAMTQCSMTNAFNTLVPEETDGIVTVSVPDDYILEKKQTWQDGITMLLADFDGSLESGNVKNNDFPITQWRLLKKFHSDTVYDEMAIIDNNKGVDFYYDTHTLSNSTYDYAMQAVSNGIYGILVKKEDVTLSFYGWKIESFATDDNNMPLTSFSFDADIKTGDITTNFDVSILKNYSKNASVNFGKARYAQFPITTIPYNVVSNGIQIDNTVLQPIKSFMEDGQPKVLRNGSGEAWKVVVTEFSYKYIDEASNPDKSQPYSITFTVVQVGDIT